MNYEIYSLSSSQKPGFLHAFELEAHLKTHGLIDRAFSKEDELIQGWLKNPETYPDELRGKDVILWGSIRTYGSPWSGFVGRDLSARTVLYLQDKHWGLRVCEKWIRPNDDEDMAGRSECWEGTVSLLKPV